MKKMLHLIVKPLKGNKAKLLRGIERKLAAAGREYELHFTAGRGDATELAARYSSEPGNEIVVVGGDGTLNEALCGLHVENAPLGLIPAGTGNDFAAAAGIPRGLAALDLILGGEPKPTDFIAFEGGRRSLNIAGMGIDVDILLRCDRMKHFTAKSKYFLSLLSALRHYRGCPMAVCADGAREEGTFLIAAVCNGSRFGGGIPICPPAKIDDGKLELVYVDCPKSVKIPFALVKLMRGKVLDLPFAHFKQCTEAEFVPSAPAAAQYDGELFESPVFRASLGRGLRMYRV